MNSTTEKCKVPQQEDENNTKLIILNGSNSAAKRIIQFEDLINDLPPMTPPNNLAHVALTTDLLRGYYGDDYITIPPKVIITASNSLSDAPSRKRKRDDGYVKTYTELQPVKGESTATKKSRDYHEQAPNPAPATDTDATIDSLLEAALNKYFKEHFESTFTTGSMTNK